MTVERTMADWSAAKRLLGGGLLSVVMPSYKLASSIARNIGAVVELLDGVLPFEIVPVDDGSGDGTAEILRELSRNDSRIRPLVLAENAGKGNALRRGFDASQGDFVLLLDADLDLSPAKLPDFFSIMEAKGADIVVGSKRHRDSSIDYPLRRRLASFAYYSMVRLLIGLPVSDTQTGMKLFKRAALQWSFERMLVKQYAFDLEVLAIAHKKGYKIAEAPIEMHYGNKVGALTFSNVRAVLNDTLAIFYRQKILHYYVSVEVAPPQKEPIFASVVIACPSRSDYLDECLAALERQTCRNFEVIVLPDATFSFRPTNFPLRIIPTGKVRPAEKRNTGIEQAKGDVVVFLDDDAAPVPNWLECGLKYFTLPDVGGVGGPGVTPPNDPFLAKLSGRVFANRFVSGNYRYRYQGDRVRASIEDFPSCNLFCRTDTLRKIGGYNTRFWPGEDTILCSDIVYKAGMRIVYDPWAIVYHHRRKLFLPHLRQVGRYGLHRGYFAKRFPKTSLKASYLLPSLFVLGLLAGGAVAPFSAWLRWAYFGAVSLYGVLTLLSSFALNPAVWLITWLGVIATHIWYGVRFAQGLLSTRMPCEVAAFDHGPDGKQ